MARNEEKSHSMLNRWLQLQKEESGIVKKEKKKRPYLAELCENVNDAQMFLRQIYGEIGRNVMNIQNEQLEEHKIRDLNDHINKLIREKGHWQRRIKELGGPDLFKTALPIAETGEDGAIRAPGGYFYFGAAKDLPGVRELLKPENKDPQQKRTRYDMYQGLNVDYYGFRDDEDGILQELEVVAEKKLRERLIEEWNNAQIEKYGSLSKVPNLPKPRSENQGVICASHVELPSQDEIEQLLLQRRKEEVLRKYVD